MEGGRVVVDQALIEKAKQGNSHAFRLVVETYQNYIFQAVYGVLRNQQDAEDATQEVFLKIYHSLPKYENQGFKTWIRRIAVNHAIDIRRKKIRRKEDQQVEYEEFYSPMVTSVEHDVLTSERKQILLRRIEELPKNYQSVVKGFYIDDKTFLELSEEENVKPKSIEVRLFRARQWMKEHWKEDDFS